MYTRTYMHKYMYKYKYTVRSSVTPSQPSSAHRQPIHLHISDLLGANVYSNT